MAETRWLAQLARPAFTAASAGEEALREALAGLTDLLTDIGWRLAEDRLIDTLIACAIALLVGYAPWPAAWHAHLPDQFATAVDKVSRYTEQALLSRSPDRSGQRRQTYRALPDLRTEFQRTMAEPPAVSRRAARLWPALIALENVMDKVTASAVRMDMARARLPRTRWSR